MPSPPTMSSTLVLNRGEGDDVAATARVTLVSAAEPGDLVVTDVTLPTSIGRSEVAGVRLSDRTASAVHCELRGARGGFLVRDLDSANGTYCGGISIREAVLPSGSQLQIGSTVLRVDLGVACAPEPGLTELGPLKTSSAAMRGLFSLLARVAPTNLSILVESDDTSESDLVVRTIHALGPRASAPLVTVECGSLTTKTAMTSLLGADGAIASARAGAIHLRNVDGLPPEIQSKLAVEAPRDVRFVASTTRDLVTVLNRGGFDENLYARVAQVRARVPPLHERDEDIPALVYAVLQDLPAEERAARTISKEAMQLLRHRAWQQGPRQLREVVERAALLASGPTITPQDLTFERAIDRVRFDVDSLFKDAKRTLVDEFEKTYLAALLERFGHNISRAAIASGIERHHLRELLRKHGLYSEST